MSLPIRTTVDDIQDVCNYLATKPTGATLAEAKAVLDSKRLDPRKLNALRSWGLIEDQDDRMKVTQRGRDLLKSENELRTVLSDVIRNTPPYLAIIERATHRHEDALASTEVAAHWHKHFRDEASDSEKILRDQAVCFFQVASGAGLGKVIRGGGGQPTRFSFAAEALNRFAKYGERLAEGPPPDAGEAGQAAQAEPKAPDTTRLGQGIFIAHGKNKKPLEQLKRILEKFGIQCRVAVDEPSLGRPISGKVRDVMKSCNCAIVIFTADEEFTDSEGNTVWRPSENVVYELGAAAYLYDNRIVIMKEDRVSFPTNFRDIGYISFEEDQLEAKATEILAELIGFGIVKVST